MELHARYTFQAGEAEVNGYSPLPHRDIRMSKNRPRLNREVATTVRAPVRHRLTALDHAGLGAVALSTFTSFIPPDRFKPAVRCLLFWKHLEEFHN